MALAIVKHNRETAVNLKPKFNCKYILIHKLFFILLSFYNIAPYVYFQRTTDFVNIISRKVPENSSLVILPADSRLIAKTLDACISNVDVMSENTSV